MDEEEEEAWRLYLDTPGGQAVARVAATQEGGARRTWALRLLRAVLARTNLLRHPGCGCGGDGTEQDVYTAVHDALLGAKSRSHRAALVSYHHRSSKKKRGWASEPTREEVPPCKQRGVRAADRCS